MFRAHSLIMTSTSTFFGHSGRVQASHSHGESITHQVLVRNASMETRTWLALAYVDNFSSSEPAYLTSEAVPEVDLSSRYEFPLVRVDKGPWLLPFPSRSLGLVSRQNLLCSMLVISIIVPSHVDGAGLWHLDQMPG